MTVTLPWKVTEPVARRSVVEVVDAVKIADPTGTSIDGGAAPVGGAEVEKVADPKGTSLEGAPAPDGDGVTATAKVTLPVGISAFAPVVNMIGVVSSVVVNVSGPKGSIWSGAGEPTRSSVASVPTVVPTGIIVFPPRLTKSVTDGTNW